MEIRIILRKCNIRAYSLFVKSLTQRVLTREEGFIEHLYVILHSVEILYSLTPPTSAGELKSNLVVRFLEANIKMKMKR